MCYGVELHRWVFACSLGSFVFGLYIQTLNIQLKITAHVYLCWQHVNPGLTGPTCPSLFLNPFPPRPAKTVPFVMLLCLMPDNFTRQRRASGWERVKHVISLYRRYSTYCTVHVNGVLHRV